jgi:hypothetical protein
MRKAKAIGIFGLYRRTPADRFGDLRRSTRHAARADERQSKAISGK